jgi:very-short-patch-repair endonuclease
VYDDAQAVVYVDRDTDVTATEELEDLGYTVIRFAEPDDWAAQVARFPHIFGARA